MVLTSQPPEILRVCSTQDTSDNTKVLVCREVATMDPPQGLPPNLQTSIFMTRWLFGGNVMLGP